MASTSTCFDNVTKYCSLCDKYFYCKEQMQQHMANTPAHPRCADCKRSFLNKNSLRNHYVLSSRHHYCRGCDKLFDTAAGLQVHIERSSDHADDYDYVRDTRPAGWEDAAARAENALVKEIPLSDDDEPSSISHEEFLKVICPSPIQNYAKPPIQRLKNRPKKRGFKYACPICYATPKTMSTTRCGHLFCTGCIVHSLDKRPDCPSCRKHVDITHLRPMHLRK
ncbi:putative zinc-finger-containing protein [Mycena floridula]|nr:putative zinc-finger-containing protein [Mycena floridula]